MVALATMLHKTPTLLRAAAVARAPPVMAVMSPLSAFTLTPVCNTMGEVAATAVTSGVCALLSQFALVS